MTMNDISSGCQNKSSIKLLIFSHRLLCLSYISFLCIDALNHVNPGEFSVSSSSKHNKATMEIDIFWCRAGTVETTGEEPMPFVRGEFSFKFVYLEFTHHKEIINAAGRRTTIGTFQLSWKVFQFVNVQKCLHGTSYM